MPSSITSQVSNIDFAPGSFFFHESPNPAPAYIDIIQMRCPNIYKLFFESYPCTITPWIDRGHGFVHLECKTGLDRAFGFYPKEGLADETVSTLEGTSYFEGFSSAGTSLSQGCRLGCGLPLEKGLIHSFLEPSIALFLGKVVLSYFKLFSATGSEKAQIILDTSFYESCKDQGRACLFTQIPVTRAKAFQAYDEISRTQISVKHSDDKSDPKFKYHVSRHNCVDFVKDTLESLGITNWEKKLTLNRPASIYEKVTAIAWHYFYFTT